MQKTATPPHAKHLDAATVVADIRRWAKELGFAQVGISHTDLSAAEARLANWLAKGFHGEMTYMEKHGSKRSRPAELVPGTVSIISLRMNYLPKEALHPAVLLGNPSVAYISRYALGGDYHKIVRKRAQQLVDKMQAAIGSFGYRVFCDSAPVLEKAIAEQAGLGWLGKHTNLIHRFDGSYFFLSEIYTDLPLPPDAKTSAHCGSCTACIDICPTQAIVEPYVLDARRCISYLTIEYAGSIPKEFRRAIGNRIYGCDDCQLICPWNRFAAQSAELGFQIRHQLENQYLLTLFFLNEEDFAQLFAGSPIRRIGLARFLRNIAIALGNAPAHSKILEALTQKKQQAEAQLVEHIEWAIAEQRDKLLKSAKKAS